MVSKAKSTKKDWEKILKGHEIEGVEKDQPETGEELFEEEIEALEAEAEEGVRAADAAAADIASLKETLEDQENKVKDYWDQVLRSKAELQNIRNRAEKDVEKAHKFGLERFANELLPVIDSIEHSLANMEASKEEMMSVYEGIELTRDMFIKALEKHGIKQLNPKGEPFNPDFHQAMKVEEVEGESNTVHEVMQRGYLLNGRLIRPALVIVIK